MIVSMTRCAAALALTVVATAASAQQARIGPKWQGWVGCWTSSVPGAVAADGGVVCITPSSQGGDAVDVTTVNDGKVASTQRIDASGADRPLEAKGCTGVQRATWSADERRVYLRSTSKCDGLESTTSGILSMTSTGEWLDVRGVSSYGNQSVRVARYRETAIPAALPAEIASALRERGAGVESARVAAGAPIGASGVIEASRAADSAVVAAWLLEREQRFSLDAKTLVQLADAGVPGAITDALVAVSNPGAFRLARASQQTDVIPTDAPTTAGRRVTAMAFPYDPWTWGSLGLDYGYRYGYPYGYRYGYSGYGYGYGNGYYGGYAPPIIIVNGNTRNGATGQMVKGQGYQQTGGSASGTARPRPSSDTYRAPSPAPSTSSGSSGSSSSGGSSSGGSSEGRTAKPRS
jgi:hypothetical protein